MLVGATMSAVNERSSPWMYSAFLDAIESDSVEKVSFSADGKQVLSIDRKGNRHETNILAEQSGAVVKLLTSNGVAFAIQPPPQPSAVGAVGSVLSSLAFPLLLIGGLIFLQQRNDGGLGGDGGGGNPLALGKSKSKLQLEPNTGVTFEDVAGCDGSKFELAEVVEFLKNPSKFSALGAKIPRGVIMEGAIAGPSPAAVDGCGV